MVERLRFHFAAPLGGAPALPSADERFEHSIRPHLVALQATARGIVGSDDLAGDVLQEALIALWREPRAPEDAGGWLMRAIVHKSLHVLRAQRRRLDHEGVAAARADDHCPLCDPVRSAEDEELRRELDLALRELSEELRAVFLLRERDGLEYADIAARLQLPVGTVRSRLSRARDRLAELLDAADGGLDGASRTSARRARRDRNAAERGARPATHASERSDCATDRVDTERSCATLESRPLGATTPEARNAHASASAPRPRELLPSRILARRGDSRLH